MNFDDFKIDEVNTEDLMAMLTAPHEYDQMLALEPVAIKHENVYEALPNYEGFVNIPPPPPTPQNAQQDEQRPILEERLGINMPSQILSSEFSGDHEFEIYINPHHGKKSPWMYSAPLSKIFIAMNQLFPIDFKCRFPEDGGRMYVRATPIYSDTQYKNQLVTRCINHAQVREKTNEGCKVSLLDHVIRCQDRNAVYGGSKLEGKHLYVRVPLQMPAPGSDTSLLNFQFMCKNSCASESGMNRRAVEVVFTLENEREEIVGRRVLNVRVCSCPKRDKDAAEKAHHQQRDTDANAPQVKKRKLEKKQHSSATLEMTDETRIHELKINVPANSTVKQTVLKAIHMALASDMLVVNQVDKKVFKKCIDEVHQLMQSTRA